MILEILKKYWGYDDFRPLQREIIESVLDGNDTLALLPTGGGKSICFQVPALALEGLCIVVSPLIALMKDQVEQLQKRGINAAAIYSGMDKRLIDKHLNDCIDAKIKLLYVSPERLKSEIFQERVKSMKITLLAIDEAHCISQWGNDFRPSYAEIAHFRAMIPPNVAIIALTATATPIVQKDIQEKLQFRESAKLFQKSFARANLSYSCFEEEDKDRKLLHILKKVPGTGVVYVRNRKRTRQIAEMLQKNQISADYYHAGLSNEVRNNKQDAWIENKIRIIVATNAFGMGIDKPDVWIVVHMDLPDSLEAYYQEAGRAGRDEKKAYAVLLYHINDIEELERRVLIAYPEEAYIRNVYQALANYYNLAVNAGELLSYDFHLNDFQQRFNLKGVETYHALKKLEEEGFIQLNEAYYNPSQVMFSLDFKELYEFQLKNPGAEPIITLLSRLRGGQMQSSFFSISETTIAQYLKSTTEKIIKQLIRLNELNIIVYEQQNQNPQVIFLTPRYDAKRLPLNMQRIEERKKRDLDKIKAVANYANHRHRCRTQILLEYFGEISYQPCEVCDICLERKKQEKPANNYDRFALKIREILKNGPLVIRQLMAKLNPKNEQEALNVIQKMVEVSELIHLQDGRIGLK
ncbi:MAG: ATP-dependent DNA helicase RecQ [Microscillaceae bacterium]|nr:ATP-dependent DNA helicase RecQ [Microscillaceae bacterium]